MKLVEVRHLLTYDCNLRCKHCYLKAGENPVTPVKFSQGQLNEFYGYYQPAVVSATGGEPLLEMETVEKLAKALVFYGGAMELVTNGFFLTQTVAARLMGFNPNTFFQISLDGDEQQHNELRQSPVAFDRALNAIIVAAESGAVTKARFTATQDNVHTIPEVIRLLDAINKPNIKLVIRPILPKGRGLENHLSVDMKFEDFDKFAELAKVIEVETTDNMGKCGCGVDTVAIDPLGDIYPCTYFTGNPDYKMGNIAVYHDMVPDPKFAAFKGGCYARTVTP